jgi:hypothetical protein
MEIVRIFEGVNNLYAFKYDNEDVDEFERLLSLWNDFEYLEVYFERNKDKLTASYWKDKDLSSLAFDTRNAAIDLFGRIYEYKDIVQGSNFDEIFEPLSVSKRYNRILNENKAKQSWIRIYALRVDKNSFIITGGAIKLTQTMQESEITKEEFEKLNKCRDYLINRGITDIKQIQFLIR